MNEVEHSHEQHGLRLEARLVVIVCKNEEDVLENNHEELLEERIRCLHIRLGDIVDQFQAHVKARSFNISVVMLECPGAGVNDKSELAIVKFEEGWWG
jgi:hypothetical protein